MSTIQIKRSLVTSVPPSLAEGELAWSELSDALYIGESGSAVTKICEVGSQANTITSVNTQTGVVVIGLDDLAEVTITGGATRHALMNNGADVYVNRLLVEADISDLGSYITSAGVTYGNLDANGDVGTSAGQLAIGNHTHEGTAILSGGPETSGDVLTADGAGGASWVTPGVTGATQLDELSDVVSATNTNRFALMANGSTGYVGRALVEADISDLGSYITSAGVTYENLDANGDVGAGIGQLAIGNHTHTIYVAKAGSTMDSGADITYVGGGEPLGLPATPSGATAAASKAYVDAQVAAVASGVDPKDSVRAVSQGANLTLSGTQTVDGVSLIAGDRILVKDQTAGQDNGIYVVAAGAWARSVDADSSAEVTSGMYCFVEEGTVGNNQGWILNTPDPIVLDTTVLDFVQFTGTGQITAGDGIVKTGATLSTDIDATSIVFNAGTMEVGTVDGGSF